MQTLNRFSTNSKSFCSTNSSTKSKMRLSTKEDVEKIWADFMTSFNYSKYYNLSLKINNSYCYTNSKSQAINELNDFFNKNSIQIVNRFSLNSNFNKRLLSDARIWIMFIIITHHFPKEKIEANSIKQIFQVFENAIQNNCDIISLFEFFLIFISELPREVFNNVIEDFINIPEEFKILYKEKKSLLLSIFQEFPDEINDNILFSFDTRKDISNNPNKPISEKTSDFTADLDNYLGNTNEYDNYEVISKDYLNKGKFMLIQNNNLDIHKCDYIIVPLVKEFKTTKEKEEVKTILDSLTNSIYQNFEYYPFSAKKNFESLCF